MDFNDLCSQTKPAETTFRHPHGEYKGRVTKISQKYTKTGKPMFVIEVTTELGRAPDIRQFGFTEEDKQAASVNEELRNKLAKQVSYWKGFLIKAGVASEEQMNVAGWDCSNRPSILGALKHLNGRSVRVTVAQDKNNPDYNITYIDAPEGNKVPEDLRFIKPQASQHPMTYGQVEQRPQYQPTPVAPQQQYADQNTPNSQVSLDSVPF
jgi:hypothetical protein